MKSILADSSVVTYYNWRCPHCDYFEEDDTDEQKFEYNPSQIVCENCGEKYEVYFGDL